MRQRLEAAKRAASQANEELRHLTDSTGAMSPQLERNSLQALQSRLEICVGDVAAFARRAEDHDNRMRLCAILGECSDRLHRLATTYNPNRTRPPV
jgi:hypothetical protein